MLNYLPDDCVSMKLRVVIIYYLINSDSDYIYLCVYVCVCVCVCVCVGVCESVNHNLV